MMRLYYFFIGYLSCSIIWRIDQQNYDTIIFPAFIWLMMVSMVAVIEMYKRKEHIARKVRLNKLYGPMGIQEKKE